MSVVSGEHRPTTRACPVANPVARCDTHPPADAIVRSVTLVAESMTPESAYPGLPVPRHSRLSARPASGPIRLLAFIWDDPDVADPIVRSVASSVTKALAGSLLAFRAQGRAPLDPLEVLVA